MFGLMTNIVQFAYWNCQKKRKKYQTHWGKYQPVYLLMLSTVLVCAQPACMLYIGSWKCDGVFSSDQIDRDQVKALNSSWRFDKDGHFVGANGTKAADIHPLPKWLLHTKGSDWPPGCKHDQKNFFFDGGATQALVPNTTTGWCIQIFGTYLGFIIMFVGVCQATLIHQKIAAKWRALRGGGLKRGSV